MIKNVKKWSLNAPFSLLNTAKSILKIDSSIIALNLIEIIFKDQIFELNG